MSRVPSPRRRAWFRGLQGRLLAWFLAAIALAVTASVVTTRLTASEGAEYPSRLVSRHVQTRVAKLWDDPAATEAYVAELRDATGLDIRVHRDLGVLGEVPRRRSDGIILENGVTYVPVVRRGGPVGVLELRTGAEPPRPWRVVVALAAALLVLGVGARRVSAHLARPLEHVAATAERFGAGDLAARTDGGELDRRGVADEVRGVGRAFDAMAERIARVVLEQRELLAAISHELRSPLGRARVALEIAREHGSARALDDVDRQLVEIDAILGDLLASARAGLADLRPVRVDLRAWISERAAAETTGPVEVVFEGPAERVEVAIDPGLLGRALHNVLANAWAHGHPKDAPIVVTVTVTPETIRVASRDRGKGFAADVLPRAFEPFVTGTGAARSPGAHGIGLGLSLVRRIVEAHGGRATADNAEGGGAVVTFELPRGAGSAGHLAPPGGLGTIAG